MHGIIYCCWGVSLKKIWTEDDSIQWVIDALDNNVPEKRFRENHKYDEVRADQDLRWCPKCKRKWEIYEGELWASKDNGLWKKEICCDCLAK